MTKRGHRIVQKTIRLFLLFEGIAFILANLTHFGILMHGYEHRVAGRAEGVIGIVLLIGLVFTWILPAWTRGIGIAAQAFALLGTCVGLYTIAIGIGPRTLLDIVFHLAIVVALVSGLSVTIQSQKRAATNAPRPSPQP